MQRNACPSDAHNEGSAVIPTGPEQSNPAYDSMRSSTMNGNTSTATPKETGRSVSVGNAGIERRGSTTDAAHECMRIAREEMTPENVHTAETVSFLRSRARTLRAKYKRMRRCHENYSKHSFNFSSPEGMGKDGERIETFCKTNLVHERWLDTTCATMERDPEAILRWNKAKKRAG